MNSKDYKEIAGIIKTDRLGLKEMHLPVIDEVAKDLASYFEIEAGYWRKGNGDFELDKNNQKMFIFNRQQFLKDCGVER